jgi:hypothetical protein
MNRVNAFREGTALAVPKSLEILGALAPEVFCPVRRSS